MINGLSPRADLLLRVVMVVLSGLALSLVVAPMEWHWLHFVVYLPMFAALRDEPRARTNALLGWLYGIVVVGTIFHWITGTIALFSNIPMVLAYVVLALFSVVFSFTYPLLWGSVMPLRRKLGDAWILAIPALQVVLEWLSQFVLLFPYNHGVSQYRVPEIWQIVSVTGVYGLSFLLFFWSAVFAEAGFRWREGRPFPVRWASAAVSVLSLVIIFGHFRYESVERALAGAPTFTVAQLQSKETMVERLSQPARAAYLYWLERAFAVAPGSVDLLVLPEGASPYSLQDKTFEEHFAALARYERAEIVVGAGARDHIPGTDVKTGFAVFNSVYHVSKQGKVTGRYDKMVPLPFGEYMPFRHWPVLGPLVSQIEGVGDFQSGDTAVVLGEGGKFHLATPICYEAILGRTCALFGEFDLFVTVTNDAWFGDTAAPHQHAMLAAVRATELGAPLYRSAYTGVSFLVEPHGAIVAETEPFTEVARKVTVRVARVPTIYAKLGDWFVLACALGLAAAFAATRPGASSEAAT